ncbi:MAG: oligosaccharide flippase family protein [Candidatus Pacebacteria bacterium]|nr:oligosaccharide flippase family protein [Candidatus Paceibacterota bacterium]
MGKKAKKIVLRLLKNQLVQGSTSLLIGSFLANLGNYLFHLLMGRMLGPVDYGALESLISLLYFLAIPLGALSLVQIKKMSEFRGRGEAGKAMAFYYSLYRRISKLALAVYLPLFFISPWLKDFLHLESLGLIMTVLASSYLAVLVGINSATLQAFLKFWPVSLVNVIGNWGRVLIAVLLVKWGWRVFGASLSSVFGSLLALSLSIFLIRRLVIDRHRRMTKLNLGQLVKQAWPFLVLTLAFTSLYTTDVVLARHFLSGQEAGFYASLAVLGKIIPFACAPITLAMFPLISGRFAAGKSCRRLFLLALFLSFLVCLGIGSSYFLWPGLMVKLLFGLEYLAAAEHLPLFALFLSAYSLAYMISQFFLSISHYRPVFFSLWAALAQLVLILFFHQSLVQVVTISIGICGLLLLILMIYSFLGDKSRWILKKESGMS